MFCNNSYFEANFLKRYGTSEAYDARPWSVSASSAVSAEIHNPRIAMCLGLLEAMDEGERDWRREADGKRVQALFLEDLLW